METIRGLIWKPTPEEQVGTTRPTLIPASKLMSL